MSEENQLKNKVSDLEQRLESREKELVQYKNQMKTLQGQITQLIEQVSQELNMAHAIYKVLIPTELPNIPGFDFSTKYEPSMISSGDYFEIFDHHEKLKFNVLMASSFGLGTSAMFMSVLLKLIAQVELRKSSEVDQILKLIASEFLGSVKQGGNFDQKAHLCLLQIDRRHFELQLASTGDVVAYWYSDGNVEKISGHEKPLSGQMESEKDFKIHVSKKSIDAGDKLVIASPGMAKALSSDAQSQFESEVMVKLLKDHGSENPHELRHRLFYDLERFTSGREPERDRTLIVMEVQDRVIKLAR